MIWVTIPIRKVSEEADRREGDSQTPDAGGIVQIFDLGNDSHAREEEACLDTDRMGVG